MEKSQFYHIDQFGVKNYRTGMIGVFAILTLFILNITFGYITFIAESSVTGSPVKNLPDAIWLMLMASTTIGFGDVYPITFVGRVMTFLMFVFGVGILGAVGALFANRMFGFADTNVKNRELRKQNIETFNKLLELEKKIEQLQNNK